jgi:type II secretory pathway predicted ATPase ExeA
MVPEYLAYWGFQKSPFSLSPDPGMLYLSPQHQEALLRLKYAVMSGKGGSLLISENAGDGKTSILRLLMDQVAEEYQGNIQIAFIDHPTLTVNQMVAEIARQIGVARVRKEKIDNLNALRVKLLELHEAGRKCLVVVDEGQMLVHKPDILQELRILLNFCVADTFLLSFVLSGQKPLEGAIRQMPEFYQRLPVRFFLRNLDPKDTAELVRHRVRAAGQTEREIFTPVALEGIYRFSQGCPRVICSVADLALLVGHSLRSQKIDFMEVSQAGSDMNKSGEPFHYYSFLKETRKARAGAGPRRRCASCRRFLKAGDAACPRCGAKAPAPPPAEPGRAALPAGEERVQCPACLQPGPPGPRCGACGFLLAQVCPRCQHRNEGDAPGCERCGTRLAGRQRLASRQLEEGLRKLGLEPPPSSVVQRFPALGDAGRVYLGAVKPRFFWGRRSILQTSSGSLEGSFFLTERAFVFANGPGNRRISYRDVRALTISPGEPEGRISVPRLRIVLDDEEVRLAFPVPTDRPSQLASLIQDFVINKKFAPAAPSA